MIKIRLRRVEIKKKENISKLNASQVAKLIWQIKFKKIYIEHFYIEIYVGIFAEIM